MKDFFQQYIHRHFALESLFSPIEKTNHALDFNQFQLSKSRRFWLAVVSYSHWVCLLGFVIGLVAWDILHLSTAEWAVPFSNERFPPLVLLKTLCVSGLIGYGTNYIAIQMLFKPLDKRPIWGQGLVPAQRERIIFTLAGGLHKHVLNEALVFENLKKAGVIAKLSTIIIHGSVSLLKDEELRAWVRNILIDAIENHLKQPHVQDEIAQLIDEKLAENLKDGWKKWLISTYKSYKTENYADFMTRMIGEVPEAASIVLKKFEEERLDDLIALVKKQEIPLEDFLHYLILEVLNRLDIPSLLRAQMAHFDDRKLEKMVREASNEQLLYIQYLGTILGVLGGLILWQPLLMICVYAIFIAGLFLLDILLYNRQKNNGYHSSQNGSH